MSKLEAIHSTCFSSWPAARPPLSAVQRWRTQQRLRRFEIIAAAISRRLSKLAALGSIIGLLMFLSMPAGAAVDDCAESSPDGKAICTEPIVTEWKHSLCDEALPYVYRYAIWCNVMGGTYLGVYVGCDGGDDWISDSEIYPYSQAFERKAHNVEHCEFSGDDRGWLSAGESVSSPHCYNGGPEYQDGIEISNIRVMNFSGQTYHPFSDSCDPNWNERVLAMRRRAVECPVGYQSRYRNGRGECYKLADTCHAEGNPVRVASGAKVLQETDYTGAGSGALRVVRYYNSQGFYRPFGSGVTAASAPDYWRTNYDRRVYPIASPWMIASMQRPDGTVRYFSHTGLSVHTEGGRSDRLESLIEGGAGSGWRYTATNGDVELYSADGRLVSVAPRGGLQIALAYDEDGRLISVTEAGGRHLTFEYDGEGRLSRVILPGGVGSVAYGYEGIGQLATVTHADGTRRTYLYEHTRHPHALTGIVDENASRFASWSYDASGRAISGERADGAGGVHLEYVNDLTTRVTGAAGNVRTYRFSVVNGERKLASMEGGPCDGCGATAQSHSYDADGFVTSETDWSGVITEYARDLLGRETHRTEAAGAPEQREISTEWHPDWRLKARAALPRVLTTWVYNGQPDPSAGGSIAACAPPDAVVSEGVPIAVVCKRIEQPTTDPSGAAGFAAPPDGAPRTWTYTYDRYGHVLTEDGPRTDVADVTTYAYWPTDTQCPGAAEGPGMDKGCRGELRRVTNAAGHATEYLKYNAHGQLLQRREPNGAEHMYAYDLRQRLTERTEAGRTTGYQYDPRGLLTRITLPDGSHLAYSYDAAHRLTGLADSLGNRITYTLDAAGNRTGETIEDASGALRQALTREFDALSRMQREQLGVQ